MKKLFHIALLFPLMAAAQSANQNYTKTTTYKQETTTSILSPTALQAQVVVTYFDGLGRPIQVNAHRQSASGKDIVKHIEYDNLGRAAKDYLPYAATTADMAYASGAKTMTESFYNTAAFEFTQNPYSEKFYEASPFNRILKVDAPGTSWKGNAATDTDKAIKAQYKLNTEQDQVRMYFGLTGAADANGIYVTTLQNANGGSFYTAHTLFKNVIRDENWISGNEHTTEEFSDKQGKVLLKRAYVKNQDRNSAQFGQLERADTYYVYDIYGNLTYSIPPKAVDLGSIGGDALNALCFQYRYDVHNRLAEKKVPGKAWEYYVYDKYDRLVATGPAFSPFENETTKGWNVIKYDAVGRNAYTGWSAAHAANNSADRKGFQDVMDASNIVFEQRQSSTINGVAVGYSNNAYPTNLHVLNVNYYDQYNYPNSPAVPTQLTNGTPVSQMTKGLPTGSWTRVITTPTTTLHETTYVFYDVHGRAVKGHQKNHYDGYTQSEAKINFEGALTELETQHKKGTAYFDPLVKVLEKFYYTAQGRLTRRSHKINSLPEVMLSENAYTELGRLKSKTIGRDTNGYLQKTDYSYNVRGWLTQINDINNLGDDLFAYKISYDQLNGNFGGNAVKPLYNGNVSEIYWKSAADNTTRKYSFAYDGLNRLNNAYYQKVAANGSTSHNESYDENVRYDKNGNILELQRNGDLDSSDFYIEIDDLQYTYDSGNRLKSVSDASHHPAGFKDAANDPDEMGYDELGNLNKDLNKNILAGGILYNHLNQPKEVRFNNSSTQKITYLYNALGVKVQKHLATGSVFTDAKTDYLSGFQYRENYLEFFGTAEGYVQYLRKSGEYFYVYNHVDHLGNVRMSYTKNPTGGAPVILSENHYYPFGLKHEKYNSDHYEYMSVPGGNGYNTGINMLPAGQNPLYTYRFNGQEHQEELGLNVTAMDFRQYDNALGRFGGIDAIADFMPEMNPYRFGFNNPVVFSDPSGLFETRGEAESYMEDNGISGTVILYDGLFWIDYYTGGRHERMAMSNGQLLVSQVIDEITVVGGSNGGSSIESGFTRFYIGAIPYGAQYSYGDVSLLNVTGRSIQTPISTIEAVQLFLDIIGSTEIPVVSQIADLGSAGISVYNEDYTGAMMSLGGMVVPGLSQTKLGLKVTKMSVKAAKGGTKLISQFSTRTIDDAVAYALKDAKVKHLFAPKHNLGGIVSELGGQENTVRAVLNAANGKLPSSGVFNNIPVSVGGQTIFIRGSVVDGVPRLGTMYIP